jgi:hypothetical protein
VGETHHPSEVEIDGYAAPEIKFFICDHLRHLWMMIFYPQMTQINADIL